jgi:hypothetical protein
MINLETGKRYRCANGRWAIICDDFNWKGELRFASIIQGRATPDWYTSDGLMRGRNVDPYYQGFRIIGEWLEPVEVWAVVDALGELLDVFDDEPRAKAFAKSSDKYRVAKLVEAQE